MRFFGALLLVTVLSAASATAGVYDDCDAAIVEGNTEAIDKFAAEIRGRNLIRGEFMNQAKACVSAAEGTPMVRRGSTWVGDEEARQEEAEKAAERIALAQLNATIAHLEKRTSCVSAKSSQTNAELEAINKRFERSNQALIIDDTHEACTELYSREKSAAMLNQTCVEAFQRMGHPNLVFSESEQKATFTVELSELIALRMGLEAELVNTRVKLLAETGFTTEEEMAQKLSADLKAKSCAEFGYEDVYLD